MMVGFSDKPLSRILDGYIKNKRWARIQQLLWENDAFEGNAAKLPSWKKTN